MLTTILHLLLGFYKNAPWYDFVAALYPTAVILATWLTGTWHLIVVALQGLAVIPPLKFLGTIANWFSVEEAVIDADANIVVSFLGNFSLKSLPVRAKK